jgi:hypothetical protein
MAHVAALAAAMCSIWVVGLDAELIRMILALVLV